MISDSDDPGKGQRAAPRVARPVMVRYRRAGGAKWYVTPLKEFSRDGARLICEEAFKPQDILELWVGLPIFPEPVRIMARVVWQKPAFGGHMQIGEYGIAFTTPDPRLRHTIDEAVQRFLQLKKPA